MNPKSNSNSMNRWSRLVDRKGWLEGARQLLFVLSEGDELIHIFKASVQTAERNREARRKRPSTKGLNL